LGMVLRYHIPLVKGRMAYYMGYRIIKCMLIVVKFLINRESGHS
jgi:hypothetical protein